MCDLFKCTKEKKYSIVHNREAIKHIEAKDTCLYSLWNGSHPSGKKFLSTCEVKVAVRAIFWCWFHKACVF